MEYLHLFKTKQEHDTAYQFGGEYNEPWVAYIDDESKEVTYNKGWAEKYLTFEALESGTFTLMFDSGKTVDYSIDNGKTWNQLENNTPTPTINAGENIMFKGELDAMPDMEIPAPCMVSSTCRFNAMGNAYSLLYGDNFENIYDITGKSLLMLFGNCANLVSAKNLSLPATTLDMLCYGGMFQGCTSLTAAPELPATTLTMACYGGMFSGCTSLTAAPKLPATTLADNCYSYMFNGCTSLTTAPELHATTLADNCYSDMFSNCTSLTTAPELPATALYDGCYQSMFSGCTSLTMAPALPATALANYCYQSMFSGCTSLTMAPALPATTLFSSCYDTMFSDCTSLTTAPALPATTLDSLCYYSMFHRCTSLTTVPELPATTLAEKCYGGMFFGCTLLSYIKMLATDVSASDCLREWVSGVASTGTFVKHPSMTTLPSGDDGIPTGWTVQDASI